MLDQETKRKIDNARDILVGKVPDPKSQVEQITIALIYKFMDDMDKEAVEWGGKSSFFTGEYKKYAWSRIFDPRIGGYDLINLYGESIVKMNQNPNIPQLFRDIFKNAYLPYRDPETLKSFLKEINEFSYDHSEKLGDAFEYLLSVMDSQGDAGQFRTPRHIIDFIVEVVDPKKNETVLDPACGSAGFLISSYKHILKANTKKRIGDKLTPDEKNRLINNFNGYDISPDMVRLSLVNMYLHAFSEPKIYEYDTLTSEERWNETSDVVLANPPFMTPKGGIRPHKRFSIQAKRSEVLFVDYIAEHLNPGGRAGVIVPEGIIFQSSNAYKNLRKMLVENFLWAVVSLPAGVFQPYSGVKTSILLMDKAKAKKSDSILFIKVDNDGFGLGAQRRPIDKNDLPEALKILKNTSVIASDAKQSLAHYVEKSKIVESGDWNLSGERYRKSYELRVSNYETIAIGDLCNLINGRAFKPKDWERKESGGFPIIRIQNLNNKNSAFNYYTGAVNENHIVNNGDLLFSWSGSRGTSFGAHIWFGEKAILNQHIFNVKFNKRITKRYLFYALNKAVTEVEENLHGGVGLVHITKGNLEKIQIPLPPLEVQKAIVEEIDGYQKIIDGARQVVDNYKPTIKIDPEWKMVKFDSVCTLEYGVSLPKQSRMAGEYPVIGSNGITGWHNEYLIEAPAIIVGRKGSAGEVVYIDKPCFPIDTTYYVKIKTNNINFTFLFFILKSMNLQDLKGGAGIPGLNRNDVYRTKKIPVPSLSVQKQIITRIEEEQKLVDANKKLLKIYEQKIKDKVAEVWGEEKRF